MSSAGASSSRAKRACRRSKSHFGFFPVRSRSACSADMLLMVVINSITQQLASVKIYKNPMSPQAGARCASPREIPDTVIWISRLHLASWHGQVSRIGCHVQILNHFFKRLVADEVTLKFVHVSLPEGLPIAILPLSHCWTFQLTTHEIKIHVLWQRVIICP